MALVRQEIVDQGLDRIELPSGNFGFWYCYDIIQIKGNILFIL